MSAKGKDTTKTAHVMNLLRKNASNAQSTEAVVTQQGSVAEEKDQAAVQPKQDAPRHPIITSLNEEAAVSQEIKSALEQELMNDMPVQTELEQPPLIEQVEQNVLPEDVLLEEETPVVQVHLEHEEHLKEPEQEQLAVIEEPVPEQPVVAEDTERNEVPVSEPQEPTADIEICNIMQVLVEDRAERYMEMFKLCCCPRCKADVQALALNNLQPKYVVMKKEDYVPHITMYERQFGAAVMAQILRACDVVYKFPRHDEEQ